LNIDTSPGGVLEIATNDLALATAALAQPFGGPGAYDVVIYVAHRIPDGGGGPQLQADFDQAVSDFLTAGGGLVSFHHGSYRTAGKDGIMALIGGQATGSVPWNTVVGQNVINVAAGHFVTSNGVEYPSTLGYEDAPRGVPPASYGFFNNTPDERYPNLDILASASEVALLFASDYDGATHVLGFTHRRPEWAGVVVAYQPGEYQPQALDDLDGNNFQILANAIVYAAGQSVPAEVPSFTLWGAPLLALTLAFAGARDRRAYPSDFTGHHCSLEPDRQPAPSRHTGIHPLR
jgi:hypothetical protein